MVPLGMLGPSERVISETAMRWSATKPKSEMLCDGGERVTRAWWIHALGFFEKAVHFLKLGHASLEQNTVVFSENCID